MPLEQNSRGPTGGRRSIRLFKERELTIMRKLSEIGKFQPDVQIELNIKYGTQMDCYRSRIDWKPCVVPEDATIWGPMDFMSHNEALKSIRATQSSSTSTRDSMELESDKEQHSPVGFSKVAAYPSTLLPHEPRNEMELASLLSAYNRIPGVQSQNQSSLEPQDLDDEAQPIVVEAGIASIKDEVEESMLYNLPDANLRESTDHVQHVSGDYNQPILIDDNFVRGRRLGNIKVEERSQSLNGISSYRRSPKPSPLGPLRSTSARGLIDRTQRVISKGQR